MYDILFRVTRGRHHVIVWTFDREEAKRQARSYLGGDMDAYVVEPITERDDTVHLHLSLRV